MSAPAGFVLLPRKLTAENGAKAALIGEFHIEIGVPCIGCCSGGEHDQDECPECDGEGTATERVAVPWTTIKEIHTKVVELFAAAPEPPQDRAALVRRAIDLSQRMGDWDGKTFDPELSHTLGLLRGAAPEQPAGCGACHDGCVNRSGGCRVAEESPPIDPRDAEIARLRKWLRFAVSQNELDMVMTGEECRACRAALLPPEVK